MTALGAVLYREGKIRATNLTFIFWDVLYPLATRQLQIDLDDGVKVNYAKFGAALKKIPGLAD